MDFEALDPSGGNRQGHHVSPDGLQKARLQRAQYQKEAEEECIASIVSVPLSLKGRVIGVMRLYTSSPREFSRDELDFAEALAEMGAIAIENARMYQRIKKDYESVMEDIYNFVGFRRSI